MRLLELGRERHQQHLRCWGVSYSLLFLHSAFHFLLLSGPEDSDSLANVLLLAQFLLPLTQFLNLRGTANLISSPEGLNAQNCFHFCQQERQRDWRPWVLLQPLLHKRNREELGEGRPTIFYFLFFNNS